MLLALLITVAIVAVGFVVWPFVRRTVPAIPVDDSTPDTREDLRLRQAALYEAIRELEFAHQAGQYSEEDFQRQRLHYMQQAAAVLQALDQQPPDTETPAQVALPHQPVGRRGRRWLQWGLIVGALALGGLGLGYWLGHTTSTPADVPALLAAADAALERGDVSGALQRYRAVLEQAPRNVMALTRLAVLAQRAGQTATGLRLIERVLQLQPRYLPALQVKGFMYYERGEYPKAIAAWESYLRLAPSRDPHRKSMQALIAQARQRAQATDTAPADAASATLSGIIRLAADAASPMPAGATLFIMARSGDGPPLAVKRIVDLRFPLQYTLGADDVMLPGRALTGKVYVSARLAVTGTAGPSQPGDLVGHYPDNPVAVGATGVNIVLERQP